MVIHSFRTVEGTGYLLLVMVEKGITIIIIINMKDWNIWPVPSPELQLLTPKLLRSSNCSLSLWSVVLWFQRDSVLSHSFQVKKPVPSAFSRKLTWLWQYSHQPWVEWRPKSLHKTNTAITVKVPLFAVCQHCLKLHVLHYITMAHHDRCIRERAIVLAGKGRLPASTAGVLYGVAISTAWEWLRKYQRDWQVGRRKETWLWRVFSPAQDAA